MVILWLAPGPAIDEGGLVRAGGARVVADSTDGSACDLAVLDARAALDLAALRELRASLGAGTPALWRVRREDVDVVLGWLAPGDDLALVDDPPALLAHRVRALAGRGDPGAVDGLTRVASRRALLDRLERAAAAAAVDAPRALVLLNLDRFKAVNDEHGHAAGDRALEEVAARLAGVCPPGAAIGRVAGDAFAVILDGADEAAALALARAALAAVREHPLAGGALRLTASAGVAVATAPTSAEQLLRRADEALFAAKARGRDPDEEHFADVTRVVAERVAEVIAGRGRRLLREAREQADRDALTGLFNRRHLDRRLPLELASAPHPPTVALADVDHFGAINKEHGWPSGDRVLQEIAARIRGALRADDWVARYGGEEICVVLRAPTEDGATAPVLERIRYAIAAEPFALAGGGALGVTISIGAATGRAGESVTDLMERVSRQLLEAKRGGRNRVCLDA